METDFMRFCSHCSCAIFSIYTTYTSLPDSFQLYAGNVLCAWFACYYAHDSAWLSQQQRLLLNLCQVMHAASKFDLYKKPQCCRMSKL